MFSQKHRLNSRMVTQTMKKGTRIFTSYFRGTFEYQDTFRVSVVVPKKIISKRIGRNREKRRILHSVKHILDKEYPNYHLIISLQKDTQLLSSEVLQKELILFLEKIKQQN